MNIVVMGTGGTGGYYGGLLALAGEEVTFVARNVQLEAIRTQGLTVKTTHAGEFNVSVQVTADPSEIGLADLVLFCVKTYDTDAAAELIKPIVGPDTVVMPIQNGIDNAKQLSRFLVPEAIIGAVPGVSSHVEAPGVIRQVGVRTLLLGELAGGNSQRTEGLQETFEGAGIRAELRPDIQTDLWEKFVAICAFAGVSSVARLPMGTIHVNPETHALYHGILKEAESVGKAEGAALPDGLAEEVLKFSATANPAMRASMYYDLVAGKRLELEALNGTVVHLGQDHAIPTPLNFAVYAALKPYANGTPVLPD